MWRNRSHPRQLTLNTATILPAGDDSGMDCAVLNFSEGGLCLLVPSPDAVPDEFELIVDPDGARHSCTVMWKSGNRVGVRINGRGGATDQVEQDRESAIQADRRKVKERTDDR
jgi:PilZ domain-containing protein